jgi:hypothetical protein
LALEEETNKRAKAEEEVKSLLKTNSSLASTAQMLGEIVKHNVNNTNTEITPTEVKSTVLPERKAYFQVSIHSLAHPSPRTLTRYRYRRLV